MTLDVVALVAEAGVDKSCNGSCVEARLASRKNYHAHTLPGVGGYLVGSLKTFYFVVINAGAKEQVLRVVYICDVASIKSHSDSDSTCLSSLGGAATIWIVSIS